MELERRTSELLDAELKLSKINSRCRQFIAYISHKLRTLMTIICGEAQATLRLKFACEEDYQATLTAILEQSVNLSRLVDDLLLLIRAAMNQLNLAVITIKIKLLLNTEVLK